MDTAEKIYAQRDGPHTVDISYLSLSCLMALLVDYKSTALRRRRGILSFPPLRQLRCHSCQGCLLVRARRLPCPLLWCEILLRSRVGFRLITQPGRIVVDCLVVFSRALISGCLDNLIAALGESNLSGELCAKELRVHVTTSVGIEVPPDAEEALWIFWI